MIVHKPLCDLAGADGKADPNRDVEAEPLRVKASWTIDFPLAIGPPMNGGLVNASHTCLASGSWRFRAPPTGNTISTPSQPVLLIEFAGN